MPDQWRTGPGRPDQPGTLGTPDASVWATDPGDGGHYWSTDGAGVGATEWTWDGTGWHAAPGSSTGWRTLPASALGPAAGLTSDGYLRIRRDGSRVTCAATGVICADAAVHSTGTVPVGFTPPAQTAVRAPLWGATAGPEGQVGVAGSSWLLWWMAPSGSASVSWWLTWETGDPWPSALPGA